VHERYGNVAVTAWGRYHPQLQRRAGWAQHTGRLPIVEGAPIHVKVDRLPGDRAPKPVWLWHSDPCVADLDVLGLFRAFLRRFDLEHMFRFFKQKAKARRSHSLPLLTYSAPGGLRQDPGRAAESSAGPRTDEDMGARRACVVVDGRGTR
jgi:hypothetical protein